MRIRSLAPLVVATGMVLPATACAQFAKPSTRTQIGLGQRTASEIRRHEKVLPDSDSRVQLVRRVGRRLLSLVKFDEPWEFSFDVIDDGELNAFSLPGGPTFVYTGLLDKLKTEDELAGIMGHEMTHVRLEHWAHMYAAQQRRNILLTLGLTVLRANNDIANLAGLGDALLYDLPYSRKDEDQADLGGFTLMTQAGYNPQGMVDVFTLLEKNDGGKMPEFLSDHPSDKNRILRIQGWVYTSNTMYPPQRPIETQTNQKVESYGSDGD